MIRVLLVDDHAIVRDGLRLVLETQPDIRVVGAASNGHEALRLAEQLRPDIVLMDVRMPELNGVEASRQIVARHPEIQVIVLSMHARPEHLRRAAQAGVRGYLLKESSGDTLVDAVRAVAAGERYTHLPAAQKCFWDEDMAHTTREPLDTLSTREREVLQMVVEGHSSAEIAQRLSLSRKTVETYRSRLMNKLGLDDVPALVKFALQHGVIDPK